MDYAQPFSSIKHKMPAPRKNYLIRVQLFRQLEQLSDYQVAIVKAGAGCGKTTLLSSFAIEREIKNLKWVTLDEHANQFPPLRSRQDRPNGRSLDSLDTP